MVEVLPAPRCPDTAQAAPSTENDPAWNVCRPSQRLATAAGKADLYPRLGPTSEWDTAAAQCVVEQAGGLVTTTDFAPLRYNSKDDILNPHFLVIGDPTFDWQQYFKD